ncbi:adenylate/guanylate cyclase domain-containing protein [Alkalilimnicola sp. S0819]|uniref:adenylate/guanylate cyclase domain-containing protein n=1 Tax=Alkalilimnicola sp. S0819 TaxID=2613922 RepID=UPI0012613CB0|nr:adenylate/guanylate cyclase domain-containing response regulator [Alkalilimnicola sp. S0819]KAB7627307.1 adenylate/guanylate cyclase domain-containing response regulator [Alkalilimnicola sp. S0819]MPQ16021.1 response regulator [Alkalilimnicola sp. S0819]
MTAPPLQPRVLVADADARARQVMRRVLETADYQVEEAENVAQVRARVARLTPDAFVLDARLPGGGGVELCQWLRDQAAFRVTPVLLVSGEEDRALMRRAFAAGCDDFTRKPLEPMLLYARLRSLLTRQNYFRQLEQVREKLARYVSPRVRQVIERRCADGAALQPEEREVCILFSDIRDFTALSQRIPAASLFAAVSAHLGAQVEIVYRHRGYVDKFSGDGIMAVFDGPNMVEDACRCALAIQAMSAAMPPVAEGLRVPLGIGIHLGPVVVGNIGSGEHLDYTVIGNSVNLAARLCGYAQPMNIVVSEAVRAQVAECPGFLFTEPRATRIRGLSEPMVLYSLLGAEQAVKAGGVAGAEGSGRR